MKDIVNSFKAHLYERTSSPLLGAFIFYWLICNYKMIVILFDDKLTSKLKFENINILYQNDYYNLIETINIPMNGLLTPLIITLIYVLILPFITNLIHKAWIWHQNKLKEISNGKVLTKKEFGDLQRRFTELELSFDDTFSKKDNEITQLKKLLTEKDTLKLKFEKEIQTLKEKATKYLEYEEKVNTLYIQKDQQKQEIEKMELTFKEITTENKKLHSEITKLNEDTSSKKEEITRLKNKINSISKMNTEYKNKIESLQIDPKEEEKFRLNKLEINILKSIGNTERKDISTIVKENNLHRIKAETVCSKLLGNLYIQNSSGYNNTYNITDAGRNFLLKNNLI